VLKNLLSSDPTLGINMRVIVRAMLPTTAGNKALKDPNFMKNLEDYIHKFNCEAAYFFPLNGNRTMAFVLDLPSQDMLPAVAEPLFQNFEASVEVHPAMNLDDLKKGISNMS
jgi:hypothetical protein